MTVLSAATAEKKAIYPGSANPAGPYSPGIQAGNTLYVSGHIGRDSDGNFPQEFSDEVRQCLQNIATVLKAADYTFKDAVAVQVYLTDMKTFSAMNEVYKEFFPAPRPARTTVGVKELVGPARIEITVTAWKDR
jgi:2-iminobutanoate/2-iminopropanoate deaminase